MRAYRASIYCFHPVHQSLGCDEEVAAQQKFPHFVPINFADVQTQCDPASRCNVRRQIKPAGLRFSERLVVAGKDLARNGDDTVSMVIVEKVSEGLLPNTKLRVGSVDFAGSFGKCESNLSDSHQAWVFGGTLRHATFEPAKRWLTR
jgi:hypothetical protein